MKKILELESSFKRYFITSIEITPLYPWLALLIVGFGLYLRLLGLQKGVWLDEAHSLTLILSQDFLQQIWFCDQPPLYFILLKLWSQLNNSEEFLRLLSVFFGIATITVRYDL